MGFLILLHLALAIIPIEGFTTQQRTFARSRSLFTSSTPFCEQVQVFDGVFSPRTCEELHDLAVDHAERSESSVMNQNDPKSPLEHVLVHLLQQLGDSSPFVEYWSRDEYMNIDAHCDVDEGQLETEGTLRYPDYSHVLYLEVAIRRGPTCVLDSRGGYNQASLLTNTNVMTVPAVQGRLLRFPGNALHAVPKPPHRWLLTAEEERAVQKEDEMYQIDDEDEDFDEDEEDWEEEEDCVERSVLLFNTWSAAPPRDVLPDTIAAGAVPEGIDMDEADVQAYMKQLQDSQTNEWNELYGPKAERIRCDPVSSWKRCTIAPPQQQQQQQEGQDSIRVRLMGKRSRRLHADALASLQGSSHILSDALEQETDITVVSLKSV